MKILCLTNSDVSAPLTDWLLRQPPRDQVVIYQEKLLPTEIQRIQPDLIVSYSYRHIIKQEVLDMFPNKFINLHISYLPFNRGADPNVWSFLEDTPKGVSIHLVDRGVDTGPVLLQKQVTFDENEETLGHSYSVLQDEIQKLFRENWHDLRSGKIKPVKQTGEGTFHFAKQFAAIKEHLLGQEGWDVKIKTLKDRFERLGRTNALLF